MDLEAVKYVLRTLDTTSTQKVLWSEQNQAYLEDSSGLTQSTSSESESGTGSGSFFNSEDEKEVLVQLRNLDLDEDEAMDRVKVLVADRKRTRN